MRNSIIGEHSIVEFVTLVGTQFKFRVADPQSFAKQTFVVPINATNGIGVDLGLGFLPYEEQAVAKGIIVTFRGVRFLVCTAEDLIIHKAISERAKDWNDIEGVLARQGNKLDQIYIKFWLEQFGLALEHPGLVARYEAVRKKITDKKREPRKKK